MPQCLRVERQKEGVSIFGPQFTPIKGTNEDFESIERIFTLWVLCTDSYYALSFSHSYFLCLSKESNQRKDTFCPNAPQDKRLAIRWFCGGFLFDCAGARGLDKASGFLFGGCGVLLFFVCVWCVIIMCCVGAGCCTSIKLGAWVWEILHCVLGELLLGFVRGVCGKEKGHLGGDLCIMFSSCFGINAILRRV